MASLRNKLEFQVEEVTELEVLYRCMKIDKLIWESNNKTCHKFKRKKS